MKKIIISLLLVLAISEAESRNILVLNKYRSGGLFGLYATVTQTYVGQVGHFTHQYNLRCSGIGFNRCRINTNLNNGNPMNPEQEALYYYAIAFVSGLENEIESKVSEGQLSGHMTKKYAWDKDQDGLFDSLVVIKYEWTAMDQDFNKGEAQITIIEEDYTI